MGYQRVVENWLHIGPSKQAGTEEYQLKMQHTVSALKKKKHYWKSTLCQPTRRLFSSLILTATKGRAGPFGEEAKKLNFEHNRTMIPNQVFPILRPVLFPVLQLSLLKLCI